MFFQQYYLDCLSHASYLIGDPVSGKAVVVDPQRDVSGYMDDARANGFTITHIIETHFHADFLSGHLELAAQTGAPIVYGKSASGRAGFDILALGDGDHISIGAIDLEILETPGHTPESICVVVRPDGPASEPYGVLTGDTLFVGDVGRPDLLVAVGMKADDLARSLYHSLHDKLLPLPDSTRVFPAHGAGSACGKNLSTETTSTIGEQKRTNYALAPMDIDDFVDAVTQGQSVAPLYFLFAAQKNQRAHELLDEEAEMTMLTADDVIEHQRKGAVVIDTRDDWSFALGHLRGSVNVGLTGRFAEYVGEVMEPDTPIVLVTDTGHEQEARTRLARIGFDNVLGALDEPVRVFFTRPELAERQSRLSVEALAERIASVKDLVLIDVRNEGEVEFGTLPGARNIPLPTLLQTIHELDWDAPTIVFCAGGYRSSIASSLLRSHGFTDTSDLIGGYGAWAASNIPSQLPTIGVEQVATDGSVLLLDCREDDEWQAGRVEGAVHIPMAQLPSRIDEIGDSRTIVCICRSGNRSGKVTAWLLNKGYTALNMTGGMKAWAAAGRDVAGTDGSAGTVI